MMPWQRYVADVGLELDPITGLPIYREIWLTVPRQSGKTTLILSLCVHRAIGFGSRQNIIYAAQTRNDARKKWEDDHLTILDGTPFRHLYRVRKTNGNEAILWRNGSMHGITSTTEKAGHGGTLDLPVIDEAFSQEDDRLEQAFRPAMVTRPAAQMLGLSTAGWKGKSAYLSSKVRTGRRLVERGQQQDFAYFEWSAPEDMDPEDPATWRAVMPALGYTVTEKTIAADLTSMKESAEGLNGFRRAYLNQWVEHGAAEPVIPLHVWVPLADRESQPFGTFAIGVDTTPDRAHTALAVYGKRVDGQSHVEIADARPGTSWAIDRICDMHERWNPAAIVIDPASAAGSFINDLEARGVTITKVTTRELVQATGSLMDEIDVGKIRHRDQSILNDAVKAAQKRELADAWTWDRRKSTDNISPLVAVTLAAHGFAQGGPAYNVLDSVI